MPAAPPNTSGENPQPSSEPVVVPVLEEELEVEKQWVEAGAVLIKKRVEARTETVPIEVTHEEVQVDRVPVDRVLDEGEVVEPAWHGDTLVVPVIEEELVVTRRRVLREELRITKHRITTQQEASEVVRREYVEVDMTGNLRTLDEGRPAS